MQSECHTAVLVSCTVKIHLVWVKEGKGPSDSRSGLFYNLLLYSERSAPLPNPGTLRQVSTRKLLTSWKILEAPVSGGPSLLCNSKAVVLTPFLPRRAPLFTCATPHTFMVATNPATLDCSTSEQSGTSHRQTSGLVRVPQVI